MTLSTCRYIWVVLFFCLTGCHKLNPGGPAAAPTNAKVVSGDTFATVTWDMVPGVQYFIYWDTGSGISPDGCGASPTCRASIQASSPFVLSGLTNGTTYSVTINGRTQGGRGGPGSPSISFVPGYAGVNWTSGSAGSNALNGITYGNIFDASGINLGNGYVAAGANGALFYGIVDINNTLNWTPITNPLPSATFNALSNTGATFLAVGNGGAIMYSANYAQTWASVTTTVNPGGYDLHAITTNTNSFVAAGKNGTILTSDSTGTVWTSQTSGTTNNLNGISISNVYVVVGDSGTLLTSPDAVTWTANSTVASSIPLVNLKGVAYCSVIPPSGVWAGTTISPIVAVGSGGTVLTSLDGGTNWTTQVLSNGGATFTGATCGHQFVVVDDSGKVFTSFDGVAWTGQVQTATGSLNAIARGYYDYTAVGAAGITFHSM